MANHRRALNLCVSLNRAREAIEEAIDLCCADGSNGAVQLKSELIRISSPGQWPDLADFGDLQERLIFEEHDRQAEMAEARNG